jgi:hypothetical protein
MKQAYLNHLRNQNRSKKRKKGWKKGVRIIEKRNMETKEIKRKKEKLTIIAQENRTGRMKI